VLKESGFDVVSLANNHTLDYGRTALMDTVRAVEEAGMVAVGAGRNRTEAHRMRLVKKNGLTVGFLAYTDVLPAGVAPLADRPSVAHLDPEELPARVRSAKKRCDVLVVSVHWGVEYMKRPTGRQKRLARLMVDNGADLILGHHPHVLQPVETYKGRPIVYSMGGFVWDARLFGADRSAIYRLELGRSSAKLVETIPIRIRSARPSP
jgi:poly-gamma-glutamate synthesis protein (capsule biosynthesis protein)